MGGRPAEHLFNYSSWIYAAKMNIVQFEREVPQQNVQAGSAAWLPIVKSALVIVIIAKG